MENVPLNGRAIPFACIARLTSVHLASRREFRYMLAVSPYYGVKNTIGAGPCELCGAHMSKSTNGPAGKTSTWPIVISQVEARRTEQPRKSLQTSSSSHQESRNRAPTTPSDAGTREDKRKTASAMRSDHSGTISPAKPLLGRLKLVVEAGANIGESHLLSDTQIDIGRPDPESSYWPAIDLSSQDRNLAHNQRLLLFFFDNMCRLAVVCTGAPNTQVVNKEKLEIGDSMELLPSDHLHLGRVIMRLVLIS